MLNHGRFAVVSASHHRDDVEAQRHRDSVHFHVGVGRQSDISDFLPIDRLFWPLHVAWRPRLYLHEHQRPQTLVERDDVDVAMSAPPVRVADRVALLPQVVRRHLLAPFSNVVMLCHFRFQFDLATKLQIFRRKHQ